jgi:type II secretory pathway component PulF
VLGVPLFLGVLQYIGWLHRDVPLLGRLALFSDGAVVMRALSMSVRQRIPLEQMVAMLSRLYPRWSIRSRLQMAGQQIQSGGNWCDSLLRVGILRPADAAVLQAAERVGNLEWALEEMAESRIRRFAYRMRIWLNILFPLVILLFGLLVAFYVIGLFLPLVGLIQGLA